MQVLVTGATGFIGSTLVPVLKRQGHTICAVSRNKNAVVSEADKLLVLDLNKSQVVKTLDVLTEGLEGVDAVVHLGDGLAARFERCHAPLADAQLFEQIKASQQLASWVIKTPSVKKMIYVSSLKAMCGEDSEICLTEKYTAQPESNYGRAKRLAEKTLIDLFHNLDKQLIILRNPIVHGPGCSSNINKLLHLADTPLPLPLAGNNGKRSTVGVENFCSAISTVLVNPSNTSGIYLLADDTPLTAGEMVSIFRKALGRPQRLFSLPQSFWQTGLLRKRLKRFVNRLHKPLIISDSAFREQFAWEPVITTDRSLKLMAEAYIERKYIKQTKNAA